MRRVKTEEERRGQVKVLSAQSSALLWGVGCGADEDEDMWVVKQSIQMGR